MTLDPKDSVALTQALIRCPSVTPEEGGALHLLQDVLKQAGFESHFVRFSESNTPDVDNLYARIGTSKPCLLFAGHTDVVPTGDETRWSHGPFDGDIVDGVLGIIDVVVMITFLGLVRQGDSHLPGEGVLVDGWNRTQIQVEDDKFFFRVTESFFYLRFCRLLRGRGIRPGYR